MSAFPDYTPDTIACGTRYRVTKLWGPKSVHKRGGPQFTSFRKFRRPRYVFELAWNLLSKSQAFTIDAHVRAQCSTLFSFQWFDWYPWWWRSVLVGTGDGATTQWVLPAKDVTDVTIFVGGATSGGGTDRVLVGNNLSHRIGPNVEDAVNLFRPPAEGRPIWAYFRGRRRFEVRYANDLDQPLTRDLETGLYNVALKLVQMKTGSGV